MDFQTQERTAPPTAPGPATGFPGVAPAAAAPPPDPYGTDPKARAEMLEYFRTVKKECYDNRWVFERQWWRNILYALGRQWIYYDLGNRQWKDKRLAKWVPRPVTNKVWETLSAINSIFADVELASRAAPAGDSPEDMATADIADRLESPLGKEHKIGLKMGMGDFWFVLTGNMFLHPWWDKRASSGTISVPMEQCRTCHKVSSPAEIVNAGDLCPGCGSYFFSPAMDPATGQPMKKQVSRGRGCTDVCSPLEIAGPMSYDLAEEWPYLIRARWRPKHWWEANHPEMVKTMVFDKMPGDRSLQLLKAIPHASEIGTQPMTFGGGGETGGEEGMTEYELWAKPSKKYPKGLFLRVGGDGGQEKILELPDESTPGPLPYTTEAGDVIWPWIHASYEHFGGRVWGRSPIDLIIQKQDQLNQLDSLTILIVNRVANPVWLEPNGAEVKKFTGEPGLVVKWQPMAGSNAKPERLEGANVPQSIFTLREQLLTDIESLAGTYDVVKGAKPTGVEAFSALQLLVERSQSRFAKPLKARGEAYRQWYQLALELERAYGPIERMNSILGPNDQWTFEYFKNADLQGNVDIIIEDGTTAPKTNLGKRAAVEQLKNFGFLNPADPDQTHAILQTFGQTNLMPGLDVHVKAARQEQDEFEKWAKSVQIVPPRPMLDAAGEPMIDPATMDPNVMPQPAMTPPTPTIPFPCVRKIWHNDPVHESEHTKWLNSDRIRMLLKQRPELEPFATQMLAEHQMAMQAAAMQAAAMQAGPGGGGKAGGGAGALASSNAESGNPADVPRGTGQRSDNRGPE